MPDAPPQLGEPYCSECGYVLTGATESSKCPECGRPLVEVLVRRGFFTRGGRRFRSKARLFGLPAIDIAFGPSGEERFGRARGFLAIGDRARGVVALGGQAVGIVSIGGQSFGVVSLGGMSIGLLSSMGGLSIGGVALGGFAVGGLAMGGGAIGVMAQGGMAGGIFARGGGVFGLHTIGPGGASSQQAIDAFGAMSWFFGPWPMNPMTFVASFAGAAVITLLLAGLLAAVAWVAHSRHGFSNWPRAEAES